MATQEHLVSLKDKHASLDAELGREQLRPLPDTTVMARLKKEKLRLKEQILRLEEEAVRYQDRRVH
ncbi:MAG: YdcH family protein [Pseudomonadota bacterium]